MNRSVGLYKMIALRGYNDRMQLIDIGIEVSYLAGRFRCEIMRDLIVSHTCSSMILVDIVQGLPLPALYQRYTPLYDGAHVCVLNEFKWSVDANKLVAAVHTAIYLTKHAMLVEGSLEREFIEIVRNWVDYYARYIESALTDHDAWCCCGVIRLLNDAHINESDARDFAGALGGHPNDAAIYMCATLSPLTYYMCSFDNAAAFFYENGCSRSVLFDVSGETRKVMIGDILRRGLRVLFEL